VRKLSGSWTRPNAPKKVNRPSWIGTPRAAFEGVAAQIDAEEVARAVRNSSPPSRPSSGSMKPPSAGRRTASGSAFVALGRSVAPPGGPMISSAREVELEGETLALRAEVAKLNAQLSSVKSVVIEESEPEIVRLPLAIAARIVGREVNADPAMIHGWIEEGARILPNRGEVSVIVSPDVSALLGSTEDLNGRPIVVDGSLPPGSCELREGSASVNVGADARLAAMADALGADS